MDNGLSQRIAPVNILSGLAIFLLIFVALLPVAIAENYVHLDFDWEGDDISMKDHPTEEFESCGACHGEEHMGSPKICEDCHLRHGQGPFFTSGDFSLRTDYEAPTIYEHYYGAGDIWVENLSSGAERSTCFAIDPILGGMCHGVSYAFAEDAGGYFAFNKNWTEEERDRDPYEYTAPGSSLPDTTDCLFCHNQDDGQLRHFWGNAKQINSTHSRLDIEECYRCHVESGVKPVSFHSKELHVFAEEEVEEGIEPAVNKIAVAAVILILVLASYLLAKRRSGEN